MTKPRFNVLLFQAASRAAVLVPVVALWLGCGRDDASRPGTQDMVAQNTNTPEECYRRFCLANLTGDEAAIRPLIVDREGADVLWQGAYPKDVAALLAEQYRTMEIRRVELPGKEKRQDRVFLQSSASPIPEAVVNVEGVWKVDVSPIIEFRRKAQKIK